MQGGHGGVAVQGAGERMLAATRSKDEYSHATRAYWAFDPHQSTEATITSRDVNLTVRDGVLNVGW
ncbi:hypothetical protein GCM10022254_56230 [Actinomadura meridiana]|uniref:Uncharacterized protein n=1 Tax=Actinomadura meridiana TaxID=559626 RepID=A0ABP8CFW4_9ACTN